MPCPRCQEQLHARAACAEYQHVLREASRVNSLYTNKRGRERGEERGEGRERESKQRKKKIVINTTDCLNIVYSIYLKKKNKSYK